MYNKGKPTLAYLSYPYSNDPEGNTRKAREIACAIMEKHKNIFVIVPHTAVDYTIFGEFAERGSRGHTTADHERAANLEYIILEKIDLFIIGIKYGRMTSGMMWEHSFVKKLNRERKGQIDIKFSRELLR